MDDIIVTICEALIAKAEAVIANTRRMELTTEKHGSIECVKTFAVNRLEEVGHIQNLTLDLTNAISADGFVTIGEDA